MSQTLANDLRKDSIDYKRDATEKAKWAHKWTCTNQKTISKIAPDGTRRPIPAPVSRGGRIQDRNANAHAVRQKQSARKLDHLAHNGDSAYDSSDDDDVSHEPATPAPLDVDDAIYSFDAARGPSSGSEVFGLAVTQAVRKFEDKQTTKLVKDEYDVVDTTEDVDRDVAEVLLDEDDFELV